MRILNSDTLISAGDSDGKRAVVEILEAGLASANPYDSIKRIMHVDGERLVISGKDYEPMGDPKSGDAVYDLTQLDRIFVFGAGKGVQYMAKAIEDVLGERLTGGHVIAKKGDDPILRRVSVTYGAHPVPDDTCVSGCRQILEMARGLTPRDLVFTVTGNGVSSLLTLPVPGVTLEDIRKTTYQMQIERGALTEDLNPVRDHLDSMKSGKWIRQMRTAKMVHFFAWEPGTYHQLMYNNFWLHSLPGCSSFDDAVKNLKKWDAWEAVPGSVRDSLRKADPRYESLSASEFEKTASRIFGIMSARKHMLSAAKQKAEEIGFKAITLAGDLQRVQACDAARYAVSIARNILMEGQPVNPPCALFTSGEMVVTVGKESGMGGSNQEFVLWGALALAGTTDIFIGSVDSDGTDGPGHQFCNEFPDVPVLAGGVADGDTVNLAASVGVDILKELKHHNASPALYKLNSGVAVSQNISLGDLTVILVRDPTSV